jgi:hypothetical protein
VAGDGSAEKSLRVLHIGAKLRLETSEHCP